MKISDREVSALDEYGEIAARASSKMHEYRIAVEEAQNLKGLPGEVLDLKINPCHQLRTSWYTTTKETHIAIPTMFSSWDGPSSFFVYLFPDAII